MNTTEARTPAESRPTLGRVALSLGILTALLSLVMAVDMLFQIFDLGGLQLIGVAVALAAVTVAIIAIIRRRGRRPAVIGLILAIAGPVLAWCILAVVFLIQASQYEPFG